MPELPDVECFRRRLERTALDRPVRRVRVPAPEILEGTTPQALGRRLHGRALVAAHRHGKYLFAEIGGGSGWLVMHFGMTGELVPLAAGERAPAHTDLALRFEDGGRFIYRAPRRLGMVGWTAEVDAFVAARGLGPDALALDRDGFAARLAGHGSASLKGWLMNQKVLAGVGNIYADEILFRARLHPKRRAGELDGARVERLFEATRAVLAGAIGAEADPERMPTSFLLRHREEGARCPRCGGALRKLRISGRGARICPHCQPR